MERRHYLALLAVAGTAGCSTDELPIPSDDTPTPEATPTETETDEPTETPTPTETEEPLSESEREAESHLQDADAALGTALDRYAGAGDAESVLEVRASDGTFEWPPVDRAASQATDPIERARDLGNRDQRSRADALARIRDVLVDAARTQSALGDAYPRFRRFQSAVIEERFGDANGEREKYRSTVSKADERLESALEVHQPADAEVSESVPRDVYEGKADQLTAERDALLAVADRFDDLVQGARYFRDGVDRYLDERWTPARDDLRSAADSLGPVADRLYEDDVGDEDFDSRYGELRSLIGALAEASGHLADSAGAYRNGDRSEGNDRLASAKDAIDASPPARRRHESAREILEFDAR